ncbi:endolytic transglycosylase MltG [Candidatus Saccharibacteria bacterium]|nr:endolytic transglycosylase MltG [Candidatus Saccharibacteria bacterium]
MKILGLDVGTKRIGVAKVDTGTKIAVPVETIDVNGAEWQELSRLARLNNTFLFVVGLPRSNEGNETQQSAYARNFAKTLTEKIPGARVRFQDESLTSVVAEERLKSRKKNYKKGEVDAEAAAIILQDFVESYRDGSALAKSAPAPENEAERIREDIAAVTKKNADKVVLQAKKVKSKTKKWKIIGIPLIIAVLIAGGVTAVIMIKQYRDEERRKYYEEQEAKMVAETFDFTIRPGETIFDVKKHLLELDRGGKDENGDKLPSYTEAEINAAFDATYDYPIMASRPAGASLEGYLYPETHNFYSSATVEDVLGKFIEDFGKKIAENDLEAKYAARGLTLYQGITLASVVQKEAGGDAQPTVAQVFLTRLGYGIPLGSDVTVSYALDVVDPNRTTYSDNAAALTIDSCYNTRLYAGLPCGPISNPGEAALLAVANPSDTAYLYFLTGDDGMMYYSYTEEEHIQNIALHCQTLCNVSL